MSEMQKQIKEINKDTKEIKEETKEIKQNLLTLLRKEYVNNPSIKKINKKEYIKIVQDYNKLKINDSNYKLQKRFLSLFRNKKITNQLVDMILIHIKKDNYNVQSVFNTDASRTNYATKIKQDWHDDKMGVKLTEYIIEPFLIYMIDTINIYSKYVQLKIDGPNQNIECYAANIEILKFISYLRNKKTQNDICKQLCPHLRMIMN
jgi:hypothetical protein